MTPDIDTALQWRGRTVYDRDGEKLGKLGALYLDAADRPAYGGIHTGLFGRNESIVPLADVQETDEGLRAPFTKADVEAAPRVDPDAALTEEEEDALQAHYGAAGTAAAAPRSRDGREDDDRAAGEGRTGAGAGGAGAAAVAAGERPRPEGHEQPAGMVRSEEEITVRPGERKPKERVRLRKVLVTEHVPTTVPRRKEVVQLETEAAPEGRIHSVEDVPPDRS